jgi:hypothetical protein
MDERLTEIEKELQNIKDRNQKVGAEKAWETSFFRRVSVAVITYIIAAFVFWAIGVGNIFLNALVPTTGYILSTLSVPVLKKWWINKHLQ